MAQKPQSLSASAEGTATAVDRSHGGKWSQLMNVTGTLSQAELILSLRAKLGMPVVDRDAAIRKVVGAPQARVQKTIENLNAELRYKPDQATEKQRGYGRDLERKLGLSPEDQADWDALTVQQASARIQLLRAKQESLSTARR